MPRFGVFLGHEMPHRFCGHVTKQGDTIFALSVTTLKKLAHIRNAIGGVYATSRIR
jgi:hypothetical protein